MDLVVYIGLKYGQGGGGPKTQKFCERHISIVLKDRIEVYQKIKGDFLTRKTAGNSVLVIACQLCECHFWFL